MSSKDDGNTYTKRCVGVSVMTFLALTGLILAILTFHWLGVAISALYLIVTAISEYRIYHQRREGKGIENPLLCPGTPHSRATKVSNFLFASLAILVVFFTLIAALSIALDPSWTTFPTECSDDAGCTRAAPTGATRSGVDLMEDSYITFPTENLKEVIIDWIEDQTQSHLNYDGSEFVAGQFTSVFFGFVDDFGVKIKDCSSSGQLTSSSSVYTQSQLRLGKSDLNVNDDRVKTFYEHLSEQFSQKTKSQCQSRVQLIGTPLMEQTTFKGSNTLSECVSEKVQV